MACYYFKVTRNCSRSVTVLNIVLGAFMVWVWLGLGGGCCGVFSKNCIILGKMRREGEDVAASLQESLSMLSVAKAVQITLWSWDTAMRKQRATEDVKRLFCGPEENAQFAFALSL